MDQIKSTSKFLHYSFVRLIHVVRMSLIYIQGSYTLPYLVLSIRELNMMRKRRNTYLAILLEHQYPKYLALSRPFNYRIKHDEKTTRHTSS